MHACMHGIRVHASETCIHSPRLVRCRHFPLSACGTMTNMIRTHGNAFAPTITEPVGTKSIASQPSFLSLWCDSCAERAWDRDHAGCGHPLDGGNVCDAPTAVVTGAAAAAAAAAAGLQTGTHGDGHPAPTAQSGAPPPPTAAPTNARWPARVRPPHVRPPRVAAGAATGRHRKRRGRAVRRRAAAVARARPRGAPDRGPRAGGAAVGGDHAVGRRTGRAASRPKSGTFPDKAVDIAISSSCPQSMVCIYVLVDCFVVV